MCYPGFRIYDFMDLKIVSEMVPSFPVSISICIVCVVYDCVRVCVCVCVLGKHVYVSLIPHKPPFIEQIWGLQGWSLFFFFRFLL